MVGVDRVLVCSQGEFFQWTGTHYETQQPADMRAMLYRIGSATSKGPVKRKNVDDALDALRAVTNLSAKTQSPGWIRQLKEDPDPAGLIPVANGLLDVESGTLLRHSPRFFTKYALPFDFDPAAECPQWERFLRGIWADDDDSIELLREWFGLLLTRDTSLQRALLWIGPRRGGKGVAARVATALLGRSTVASPTLSSLGQPFGLQPLIGALLALLSDVRLSHHADLQTIAENILRVTGEDLITIPRKFLPDLTCTLAVRFWILSNEAPRFLDSSGALPSRFLVLTSTASFLGHEDPKLTDKLLTELPGIFLWALAGLRALRDRGNFRQPESARAVIDELEAVASPIKSFLADECDLADPVAEVLVKDLFAAWRRWCAANGREHPGSQQVFGRDLRSAIPHLATRQPRIGGRQVRVYLGIRLNGDTQ